jgi:MoaA/NifB/PqqE/SkfB family radical SAM enzyme
MRGVPGNFEKALESARLLRTLKPRFRLRLIVNINTVITRDNLDEILPLAELIQSERLADGHYFNLIRGNAKDPRLKNVEREKLRAIYSEIAAHPVELWRRNVRRQEPVGEMDQESRLRRDTYISSSNSVSESRPPDSVGHALHCRRDIGCYRF